MAADSRTGILPVIIPGTGRNAGPAAVWQDAGTSGNPIVRIVRE